LFSSLLEYLHKEGEVMGASPGADGQWHDPARPRRFIDLTPKQWGTSDDAPFDFNQHLRDRARDREQQAALPSPDDEIGD
jgi:hypothetical protein